MRYLVPDFVLDKHRLDERNGHLQAIGLFVDVSGFTTVTEVLMAHGQHGAEVLADVMLAIFAPLVENVYEQGGFICGFAGDAFTALFPISDEQTPAMMCRRALAAGWRMQQHMEEHPVQNTPYGTFVFAAKIGVASGTVEWGVLSGSAPGQHTYYFRGPAVDDCARAEHHAAGGDLILSRAVYEGLPDLVTATPVDAEDVYFKIAGVTQPLPAPQAAGARSSPEQMRAFYPETLLNLTLRGEFRDTINVFVNLASMTSHDQLAAFMSEVFALQKQYGGFFNRIDFGDKGCYLLLFWGAPVAYENDLERALNFILDLQSNAEPRLRVGVTYHIAFAGFMGSSLREEYTCYSRGVNLAARYMTAAPWQQVWLDAEIAERAREHFLVEFVDNLDFKGFSQKQPVFVLRGRKELAAPQRYRRHMVGREAELDRLAAAVAPIYAGRFAGVVTVYGEPGMGKSRLLYAFAGRTRAAKGKSAPQWFHCPADDLLRQSLNPFRHWLRNYFEQSRSQREAQNKRRFQQRLQRLVNAVPEPALRDELERTRSILGALVDLRWPDSLYEQLEPQLRFENTLSALKTLIQAESLLWPVIVEVEDAHWLDDDSRQFLPRLTRNVEGYPFALVVTARGTLGEGLVDPAAQRTDIYLEELGASAIARLVQGILGHPPAPDLLQLLSERTDGNPFFVEQIVLYLRDQGLSTKVDTREAGELVIPTDVRSVLVARLDRLTQEVKEVVQTAAVLGREFEVQILSKMLRGDEALRTKVRAAERAAIWNALDELRYLFRHALLRDAAYDMQLRSRLRQLHRVAAEAFTALYRDNLAPHYAEIAYHYDAADEDGKASTYYERAGEHAKENYHNEDAVAHFSRALQLTGQEELESSYRLLLGREEVYDTLGRREEQAEDLAALARVVARLEEPQKRAQTLLRQARYEELQGAYQIALQTVERAAIEAEESQDLCMKSEVYWQWGKLLIYQAGYEAAEDYLVRALQMARTAGEPLLEAHNLHTLGTIEYMRANYTEAEANFQQAQDIFEAVQHRRGQIGCLINFGSLRYQTGSYIEARRQYEKALVLGRRIGWRHTEAFLLASLGNVAFDLGDYGEARRYHKAAMVVRREIGDRPGEAVSLDTLGLLHYIAGENEMAATRCEQALQIQKESADRHSQAYTLFHLGLARHELGRLEAAHEAYAASLHLRRELDEIYVVLDSLGGLARVALAREDVEQATSYAAGILATLAEHDCEGVEMPVLLYLTCYRVLRTAGKTAQAGATLQTGYDLLQERAAALDDPALRQQYLHEVPFHRALLAAHQRESGAPAS